MNKKITITIISILALVLVAGGFWVWQKNNQDIQIIETVKDSKGENNQNENNTQETMQSIKYGTCREDEKIFFENNRLNCEICPVEGSIFPDWCDLSILKEQPDCLFNFCGKGGIDLGNNYRKYKDGIYYWYDGPHAVPGASFIDANPNTFQSFGEKYDDYGKDDKKVFMSNYEIKGADPATFELLKYNGQIILYARDESTIFYGTQKVNGADLTTFKVFINNDRYMGKDKFNCYRGEYVVNEKECENME